MTMRTSVRTLIAGTVLLVAGLAVAGSAEPYLGTWTLNAAKSQFVPAPGPKSMTRVYVAAGDAVDLTITGVAADGKPIARHSVFKFDGKDYAYTGNADFDAMTVKRIDSSHYETTTKKAGKAVGTSSTSISADGKVFTQVSKGVDASGAPTSSTAVYDRK
jgi:hypothetical protein